MIYTTPAQMKLIEAAADKRGASYKQLMENAGMAVAELVCKIASEADISGGVLVLCGKGNNGGDGFVAAHSLCSTGIKTTVVLTSGEPSTELSAYEYCELSENPSVTVLELNDNIDTVFRLFSSCSVIIDAVYGTGFHGELPPELKACFAYASRCRAVKIAADVPSGGNCLDGKTAESTMKCDYTVTFGYKKTGMLFPPLCDMCGEIIVADIGFEPADCDGIDFLACDVDEESIKALFPERSRYSYKNKFGHLLNVAGSRRMSGAAALSTMSALRSGVGLCTLASTDEVISRISPSVFEAMYVPLPADEDGAISPDGADEAVDFSGKVTAASIGCGLSCTQSVKKLVKKLLDGINCPIVLDADGINCIADSIDISMNTKNKLIITPHQKELERLFSDSDGKDSRLERAVRLAREYPQLTVVAKGYPTIIAGGKKLCVCYAGNPGLSKGGSGDVLTGIIAAFAAQGIEPFDAAAAGVFVHGRAADLAAQKLSQTGMLPTDVIAMLPYVFKEWNR